MYNYLHVIMYMCMKVCKYIYECDFESTLIVQRLYIWRSQQKIRKTIIIFLHCRFFEVFSNEIVF